MDSVDSIISKLSRGSSEIISIDALKQKLAQKKKLRIKAGFDPTAADIHLGHVVLLRKLRQFQDLGHTVDFVIGDFTALVGDPTGKNKLRPKLEPAFIAKNAKTYKNQALKILQKDKTNFVENSKWLGKLTPYDLMSLTSQSTVAQMLARNDFKKRFEDQVEISIIEFIYPLLQGYDSFHLKSDIELGGTDQKFNLLMGRQIQENYGMKDLQVVMMTPLLEGTDGVQKMSKSLGNYIGITEEPKEIFGKVMSISDELMMKYYEYLTDQDLDQVRSMHPKEAKMGLAFELVEQFYDKKVAVEAQKHFESVFSQKGVPDDMPVCRLKGFEGGLAEILVDQGLVGSKNEARRLIKQGAVAFNDVKIDDENWPLKPGILKVGKRRFLKLEI